MIEIVIEIAQRNVTEQCDHEHGIRDEEANAAWIF